MSGDVEMVAQNLAEYGEAATFRRFTGNTGDGVSSAPVPGYAAAVTVQAMAWTATDKDAGGASERTQRFVVGAEELTAASVTEVKAQDKLVFGGIDYQVKQAERVRSAGENLYFDVEAVR